MTHYEAGVRVTVHRWFMEIRSGWPEITEGTFVGQNFLRRTSLQLRILRLGLFEDRDVRVGVFRQREEILICGAGFGGVALHGVGSGDLQVRQSADGLV